MPEVIKVFAPAHEIDRVRVAAALQNLADNPSLPKMEVPAMTENACAGRRQLAKPPSLGGVRKPKDAVVATGTTARWEQALAEPQHRREACLDRGMHKRIVSARWQLAAEFPPAIGVPTDELRPLVTTA